MTASTGKVPPAPTGVIIIPDDIADAWESAKALHAAAVSAMRSAEPRLRAYMGNAEIGVREDGRAVCQRVLSTTAGKYVKVHHRDDLRMVKNGGDNGK